MKKPPVPTQFFFLSFLAHCNHCNQRTSSNIIFQIIIDSHVVAKTNPSDHMPLTQFLTMIIYKSVVQQQNQDTDIGTITNLIQVFPVFLYQCVFVCVCTHVFNLCNLLYIWVLVPIFIFKISRMSLGWLVCNWIELNLRVFSPSSSSS